MDVKASSPDLEENEASGRSRALQSARQGPGTATLILLEDVPVHLNDRSV